eukprot:GHVS01008016.1.p1 GENE.GHVS01008016.1~~GHVS01008016.1.p1  ORF type:complete len:575 (-),score=114.61 GHVS01008016.1:162-1886(-)
MEERYALLQKIDKEEDGSSPSPPTVSPAAPNGIKRVAAAILSGRCRRIVVAVGAGISVAAGIPDFRSPNSGLYSKIRQQQQQQDNATISISCLPRPEAIFDLDYFRVKPLAFCCLAKELFPGNYCPTKAHLFSVLLQRRDLLVRHYTQNIDTLERKAGVDGDLLVEAHGSFAKVHCIECGAETPLEQYRTALFADDRVPRCQVMVTTNRQEEEEEVGEEDFGGSVKSRNGEEERTGNQGAEIDTVEIVEGGNDGVGSNKTDQTVVGQKQEDHGEINLLDLEGKFSSLEVSSNTNSIAASGNATINGGSGPGAGIDSTRGGSSGNSVGSMNGGSGGSSGCGSDRSSSTGRSSGCVASSRGGDVPCGGLLKPDITFFGESLDQRFFDLCAVDFPSADLLIVMGTSLQVRPFAHLVHLTSTSCDRLMVNKQYVENFRPRNGKSRRSQNIQFRCASSPGTSRKGRRNERSAKLSGLISNNDQQNCSSSELSWSSSSAEETEGSDAGGAVVNFEQENVSSPDGRRRVVGKDYFVKGECDEVIEQLCDCLGWRQELEQLFENCKDVYHREKNKNNLIKQQ